MTGASALQEALRAEGVAAWPGPIECLTEATSTSDRAKHHAAEGWPEWGVVVAERQTAGRGRSGHAWISPPGGLYLSVVLRPRVPPARIALLPLAAGVAVAEAVGRWLPGLELKWPNDVLVRGRKIGGLLAEANSGPRGVDWVVLGIGVNVAPLPPAGGGAGLDPTASLDGETGRTHDRLAVAAAVLARLTVWYDALGRADAATVVAAWRERAVDWWGRSLEVRSGERVVRGTARGIDDSGALVLEGPDGGFFTVVSGEAREVRVARA